MGSGMAAVSLAVLAIAGAGDEIVSGNSLFMSTFMIFNNVFKRFGVTVKLIETTDLAAWQAAVTPKTKALFVETIGNPKMDIPRIRALADLAHANRAALIVDNTLATPYLFRPITAGADVVVHSTTKYLNGHGSATGGVVIDAATFDWPLDKFPDFKVAKDRRGPLAFLDKVWRELHINLGTTQSPFSSYLTLIGLDTLGVRMERCLRNAQTLAEFLTKQPQVKWVNYPGLPGSPHHATAKEQFGGRGYSGLLTFGLANEKACFEFIRNLKLVYHLANLGDCKTLAIHPWSSQYINMTEDVRRANGITPDMIRISVGIEDIADIQDDIAQALKA
jgi:O-acetylhomoserine (thiol)-lyase